MAKSIQRTNSNGYKIGLGCSSLGKISPKLAKLIFKKALLNGIKYFDFGRSYGHSEESFGKVVEHFEKSVFVATKSFAKNYTNMKRDIKISHNNLHVEEISMYQIHGVDSIDDYKFRMENGVYKALKEAQKMGIINEIGLTTHSPEVVKHALQDEKFSSIMICNNLGLIASTRNLLKEIKIKKMRIIVMKPLGGGLLLPPSTQRAMIPKELMFLKLENVLGAIASLPEIDMIIPGIKNESELDELLNVKDSLSSFSDYEIEEMDHKVVSFFGEKYCRYCKYCCPCAEFGWKFDFPNILRAVAIYDIYNLKTTAKEYYYSLPIQADMCIQCGKCEPKCPFKIPIRAILKRATKIF